MLLVAVGCTGALIPDCLCGFVDVSIKIRNPALQPLAYAYIAGVLGGQQNVLLKSVSENAEQTVQGNKEGWKDPFSYISIVLMLSCAAVQASYPSSPPQWG